MKEPQEGKEKWEIINHHPNYVISSYGRVRNLNTGRILKWQESRRSGGYAFVNLYKNGQRINANIHTLVSYAFLGPRPPWKVVHHKDEKPMNPRLFNLEYITHKENNHHNQLKKRRRENNANSNKDL